MDYHDALAAVGAGSAHPGGMKSTKLWMDAVPLTPSMKVLDVGCGTGRSALEVGRTTGCEIVGVDIRSAMIQKARRRAQLMHQNAHWRVASAEKLPFPDEEFDLVLTESVNVFVKVEKALKEYWRVLKQEGYYVDVEMMLQGPVSNDWKESAKRVYGVKAVPDLAGWRALYQDAGFSRIEVLGSWPVRPEDSIAIDNAYPDTVDLSSPGVYRNPSIQKILRANADWLEQHHRILAYVVCLCRK